MIRSAPLITDCCTRRRSARRLSIVGEVEAGGNRDPVPVEAVGSNTSAWWHGDRSRSSRNGSLVGGEEQLDRRPVELVVEVVVVVRTTAECAVVVGREQRRVLARRAIGDASGLEQPSGVPGVDVCEHPCTVRAAAARFSVAARRRSVEHSFCRILVWPHRERRPFGAVHTMERIPANGLPGGHLHAEHPVELPPALGEQRVVDRRCRVAAVRADARARAPKQLRDRQTGVDDVLAVVAGVVPPACDVELPVATSSRDTERSASGPVHARTRVSPRFGGTPTCPAGRPYPGAVVSSMAMPERCSVKKRNASTASGPYRSARIANGWLATWSATTR